MLDGLTLDMAGEARSVEDYQAVVDGVGGGLPEGLVLVANGITPAFVEPYGWSGRKNGNSVILTGYVPSLAGPRGGRGGGGHDLCRPVVDQQRQGGGGRAEDGLDRRDQVRDDAAHGARERDGRAWRPELTRSKARRATRTPSRRCLRPTRKTLPASLELSQADVAPPRVSPYTFAAARGDDSVVLTGFAPSESDKADMVETARDLFGGLKHRGPRSPSAAALRPTSSRRRRRRWTRRRGSPADGRRSSTPR